MVNNTQPTTHLYGNAGSYVVQLLTVSNFGCRDSIVKTSIVNPNPIVKITAKPATAGCDPLCVNFIDSSSILTGNKKYWVWNVGDGSANGTTQTFEHCYINSSVDSVARFTVSLTVTSDSGCVTTGTKNNYIAVYPNPKADFTVQPSAATFTDPVISITNLSAGASLWKWNFGDSDTSKLSNPAPHTYADTGAYKITLFISTQYGCRDTTYQNITIEPDFVFYIPSAFSPDGDHINDSFSGKGIFISQYEMSIYDRWGNLIFFSEDINIPWDGKANHGSEVAPRDVYVYSIKVTDIKKRKHSYNGVVTLLR
jgi:gliding motility-associated-like protein